MERRGRAGGSLLLEAACYWPREVETGGEDKEDRVGSKKASGAGQQSGWQEQAWPPGWEEARGGEGGLWVTVLSP